MFSEAEDEVELRTQALSEMTTWNPEQDDAFKRFQPYFEENYEKVLKSGLQY
jgi:hypothetical protein